MHPLTLDALGRPLYGPRYVTALAEALTAHAPEEAHAPSPVTAPHVTMWIKGRRSMPDWIDAAALRVAKAGVIDLKARAKAVEDILWKPWEYGIQPPTPYHP
jgi:hypothetical protein